MAVNNLIDRSGADVLIPEEQAREIIQGLPQNSAALSMFRQVRMSSKVRNQPVLSALPNAYWVTGDTGLKQTTDMGWGSKQMVAEELAVIVPIPEAVLDDSDYDIFGEVRPRLVEAFGEKIDAAVLFGTEKPVSWTDPSIVEGAVAAGNTVALGTSTIDIVDDINEVMALVEEDDYDVNGFAARRAIRARLRGLRDADNNPIYSPSLAQGQPATLFGEPLTYVRNRAWDSDEAELIAGDFSQAVIGIRQDITFKLLDQAVISDSTGKVILNLAQQDSVALRAVMRVGYAVNTPMTRANMDADDPFPFGVLLPEEAPVGGED